MYGGNGNMNLAVMAAGGGSVNQMPGQMGSMNSEQVRDAPDRMSDGGFLPLTYLLLYRRISGRQQSDPGAAGRNRHADTRGRHKLCKKTTVIIWIMIDRLLNCLFFTFYGFIISVQL